MTGRPVSDRLPAKDIALSALATISLSSTRRLRGHHRSACLH
jgi:hypothetical protein